jgi:hypothetical protein
MSGRDPEHISEDASTGAALAGLAEGFARDWVTNGTILLSIITAVAGVVTGNLPWVVLGPAIGILGVLVGWTSIKKRWSIPVTWAALLAVLAVEVVLLVVMFA